MQLKNRITRKTILLAKIDLVFVTPLTCRLLLIRNWSFVPVSPSLNKLTNYEVKVTLEKYTCAELFSNV